MEEDRICKGCEHGFTSSILDLTDSRFLRGSITKLQFDCCDDCLAIILVQWKRAIDTKKVEWLGRELKFKSHGIYTHRKVRLSVEKGQ
jgi:hypothetical protein